MLSADFLYTFITIQYQFQSEAIVFSILTVVDVANHVQLVVVSAALNQTVVLYTVQSHLCRTNAQAVRFSHAVIGIVFTLSGVINVGAHVVPVHVLANISAAVACSAFHATVSLAFGVVVQVSTLSHNPVDKL